MKLPPYPKYKPSGIEWLGEVPAHWVAWKATHGFRTIGSGTTPKSDDSEYYDGNIPWVTTSELRETVIVDTTKEVTATAMHEYPALRMYPKGTLLFAMYGATIGRLGILGIAATVNQACAAFAEPLHLDTCFVYYWLQMRRPTLIVLSAGGGQPNLSQDDLRQLRIPAPPLDEQHAIAEFLDRETAKIDMLMSKKRTLIERLKEKRTALIARTVTRGLPPDAARAAGLTPHSKLKPTGIDWLGEVPEHWEVKPLGRLVRFASEATPDKSKPEYWDGDIPWVSPKDMKRVRIDDVPNHVSREGLSSSALTLMPAQSVLIVVRGMILAHSFPVAITGAPVTINQDMKTLTSGERLNAEFLLWLLTGIAGIFVSLADESAHGTRKLESEIVARVRVALPSTDEQISIVDFLDRETAKIDALIAKIETAIERLQEHRTALIIAAVTGKIDVRGTVVREKDAA